MNIVLMCAAEPVTVLCDSTSITVVDIVLFGLNSLILMNEPHHEKIGFSILCICAVSDQLCRP